MKPKFTGTEKMCIDCKDTFTIENFYMAKKTKVYSSRCKKCDMKRHRQWFGSSYKNRAITLFHTSKHGSKIKNKPFDITKDDIINQYEKQNGKCYYTGSPLSCIAEEMNTMSVDRKDSNLGYTKENIVICTWKANKMKNDLPESEFLSLCKQIHDFSNNRTF